MMNGLIMKKTRTSAIFVALSLLLALENGVGAAKNTSAPVKPLTQAEVAALTTVQDAAAAYYKRKPRDAYRLAMRAIRLDPKNGDAFIIAGAACHDLDQTDQALKYINEGFALNHNGADILGYETRAQIFYKLGKFQDAIDDASRSIALKPKDSYRYSMRGSIYVAQKRFKEAVKDYDTAVRLAPNPAEAYFDRANCFMFMREYQKALADYNKAISLEPHQPSWHGARAAL